MDILPRATVNSLRSRITCLSKQVRCSYIILEDVHYSLSAYQITEADRYGIPYHDFLSSGFLSCHS